LNDDHLPTAVDVLVAEVDLWDEQRCGAVYYLLFRRRGVRISQAEALWSRFEAITKQREG
jgi:hypothetical protein